MPEGIPRVEVDYLRAILSAHIYDLAVETALDAAPKLSSRLNQRVWLKREDQQPVFSFKLRGAYNKLRKLSPEQRANGVVAVSAGNHAQGVAMAARHFGTPALIVMPRTTPSIKIDAVRQLGAQVELVGDSYDDAAAYGIEQARLRGLSLVHPYDDVDVIAGQGTVGMELLRQARAPLDAVFVPVGGGGLIAGVVSWIKALEPQVKVIGVEPIDAACLHAALQAGHPVTLAQVGLFVDGVAVKRVGTEPFRVCQNQVDEVVLVSTDEICAAIRDIFEETRTVVEPAGALALAGLKRWSETAVQPQQNLVAIVSGANMNFDRLAHVAERAQIGEHHEAVFGVGIPEQAGSFLNFCRVLGRRSITEFNYRYAAGQTAQVFVGITLRSGLPERAEIAASLRAAGYQVCDYTDNEMAKLHVRHLVGGRSKTRDPERLVRFEFPERPGALLDFLEQLSGRWNISLFHYRNHGAAYGRVLAGLEVADADLAEFVALLDKVGFAYWDETENPAMQQFLLA